MAVAHDAQTRFPATENTADTTSGTRTFTHTPSGTPKGVVVTICGTGTAALCTGVSYGSSKMRLRASANDTTEAGRVEVWVLESETVPTGAQTVSIFGATTVPKFCTCSTVTASTTHTRVVTTAFLNTQSTANPQLTMNPGASVSGLAYIGLHTGATAPSGSPLSGCTLQNNRDYGTLSAQTVRQTTASTGSRTVGVTLGADDWCAAGICFEEWDAPDGTTLAPQHDAAVSGEFTTSSTTISTFQVKAGGNRALIVEITGESDGSGGIEVNSMTWNGVNLTKKVEADNTTWSFAEMWALADPDEGVRDLVITLSAADQCAYAIYSYDGADQTDIVRSDLVQQTGNDTSVSDTISSVATSDYVHAVISVDATGHGITPTSGSTTMWEQSDLGHESEGSRKNGASGTVTIGWTWTTAAPYSHIGYAIMQFSSGPTDFPLDAAPGSYSITGVAAGTLGDRFINAVPGDYILTGSITALSRGFEISVDPGSYSLTGSSAGILADRLLSLDLGSYALVGFDASVPADRSINAESGSYLLTGFDADLVYGALAAQFSLNAEPGVYTITGAAAAVLADRILSATAGSYDVIGAAATTARGYFITAESGGYSITGTPANLTRGLFINAVPGEYTMTGAATSTLADRIIEASPGVYNLTGVPAGVVAGYMLNAEPGTYIVTGAAADLVLSLFAEYSLNAEPGEYLLTGFDTTLKAVIQVGAAEPKTIYISRFGIY